jgi:beta-galactosidase
MSPTAWLDWMTFGQKAFADFFQWERSVIREVAPKIALVNKKQTNPWDNSTASSGTNWHLMGLSEDIYGLNTYGGSEAGYRDRLDAARSYAHGKPVVVFETNAMPANAKSRTPDRIELQLWSQILGGADGMFIFAMIPNGEHGILGDRAADDDDRAAYARFVKLISTHQRELASPHVKARVAVLYSTTAAMQYTQDIVPRYVLGAFRLLRDNHYQVDILPQERCDLANLQDYELLVLPTRSILMPDQEVAIAQWVAKGGKILAFADSLAKDWKMQAQTPPRFLGLDTRKPPIGDRDRQTISVVDDSLQALITEEISISGVELVSNVKEPGNLLPGQGIDASQKGKVLAYNSDSYPAIIETIPGRVIYCAFDSVSHLPMRHLVEGLVRQNLGLDQHVRLTENHMACPGVLTSLREDYKDPSIRYLLVMNTHSRNHQVSLEANSSWQVLSDELGAITVINQATSSVVLDVPQRSVGLLKLRRSN